MKKNIHKFLDNKEKIIEILFVIILTILCFSWSIKMPYKYGPDEEMKMDVCNYIYKYGSLPNGADKAVRDECWGISYSFTPILDYMFSGLFMKAVSIFNTSEQALLVAARAPSVISYMGTLILVILISKKLFKRNTLRWLFIVLVSCLPQFMFLGSYVNNDCFAVFCIALIVYAWIIGLESKWKLKSCILLGVGIGICALSYYNAYGFILTSVIIFIASYYRNWKDEVWKKDFWKKVAIISILAFIIAGWWFIRSAYLNNGDFLGLSTTDKYGEKYAEEDYKPSERVTPEKQNQSLLKMLFWDGWVWQTTRSFIAVFGNMTVIYPIGYYIFYLSIFIFGIIGAILYHQQNKKRDRNKNRRLIETIFKVNIIIPILLSLYYSYYSDFQAQGRYIMPAVIPIMYFITKGIGYLSDKFIRNKQLFFEYGLVILLFIVGSTTILLKICEI